MELLDADRGLIALFGKEASSPVNIEHAREAIREGYCMVRETRPSGKQRSLLITTHEPSNKSWWVVLLRKGEDRLKLIGEVVVETLTH